MTTSLHLPARAGAPVACDMSTAEDTPDERVREYRELFERALLRHERGADSVALTFRADPGTREAVEDLARREAACCPFLDYRVETAGAELTWTIRGDERAEVAATLDAFHALAAGTARAREV
jgi:hypothetical protein